MNPTQALTRLARLYGVQTDYRRIDGRQCRARPEILMAVLRSLGAPVERAADVSSALREKRLQAWSRVLAPVTIVWNQEPLRLKARLPKKMVGKTIDYEIRLEDGAVRTGRLKLPDQARAREVERRKHVSARFSLDVTLPYGYHRLKIKVGAEYSDSLLVAAPRVAYDWPAGEGNLWGLFLPLYALHTKRSWGAGDFSDLLSLTEWTRKLGGRTVSTLPLVPTLPFDPSPYSPVSRLFWNEFYLDPEQIPELAGCRAARALLASADFQAELEKLRSSELVDYEKQTELKRGVLEKLVSCFLRESSRMAEFDRFLQERPSTYDYASFRAIEESQRRSWEEWPPALRDRKVASGSHNMAAKQYHLCVQWLLHEQMAHMARLSRGGGRGLFLDLPLGVSRNSYDVWRYRSSFALDASGGAPPDEFFTKGQNWGFPPLHPERMRASGHGYFIDCIRHHLRYAGILRIDHVMGLHRLFWIPRGAEPSDGVYVRYPSEDLYAILCLESYRHRSVIVGENLGTVPDYVNSAMARHRIYGLYVGQFQIDPNNQTVAPVPQNSIAAVDTHDTPTFAAFWRERDIEDRVSLGLLDEESARNERERRGALRRTLVGYLSRAGYLKEDGGDPEKVLKAFLAYLASSSARCVLVNLEDLWLEEQPQNVPGTWKERPNWRRKTRYRFEDYCTDENILYTLRRIGELRKESDGNVPGKP
jgi:4-alpha-glucanotransferase